MSVQRDPPERVTVMRPGLWKYKTVRSAVQNPVSDTHATKRKWFFCRISSHHSSQMGDRRGLCMHAQAILHRAPPLFEISSGEYTKGPSLCLDEYPKKTLPSCLYTLRAFSMMPKVSLELLPENSRQNYRPNGLIIPWVVRGHLDGTS